MEIKETDYVLGFWFGPNDLTPGDFLMTVIKREQKWICEYRFRTIVDDKRGLDSEDEKRFHSFEADVSKLPEEKLLETLNLMVQHLSGAYTIKFYPVDGDFEKMIKVYESCDFTTITRVDEEGNVIPKP